MGLLSFMIGPSSLFRLPNSPLLIGVGILLVGGARGVCMALCPNDAITGGIEASPHQADKVSDLVASIYNLIFGVCIFVFLSLEALLSKVLDLEWL